VVADLGVAYYEIFQEKNLAQYVEQEIVSFSRIVSNVHWYGSLHR